MDINSKLILGTWQFGGDRWQNVSQRNCIETLANLEISWLLHQDLVYPIVGSSLPEQIEQTSKALTIKLDSADIKAIGDIGMSVAKPFLDDPQTHHFGDNWEDLVNLKN